MNFFTESADNNNNFLKDDYFDLGIQPIWLKKGASPFQSLTTHKRKSLPDEIDPHNILDDISSNYN
jgi:hypothetical protein